jgi:alpha-ribazole phosphatase
LDLYLVRHGETESNIQKRYQGWTESPLSEDGLCQAEKAGRVLSEKQIDAIYCSDLRRASHTAEIIGLHNSLKPEATPLLREINFGQWEGLTFKEIEASWGNMVSRWLDDPFKKSAPEGETLLEVGERMRQFVNRLVEQYPDGRRIVAVSHGGSIRALLHNILGLDSKSFWDISIENASISLVRYLNGESRVIYYNRTDHLESE